MIARSKAPLRPGLAGGGVMTIFVDPSAKLDVQRAMADAQGHFVRFNFSQQGVQAWAR